MIVAQCSGCWAEYTKTFDSGRITAYSEVTPQKCGSVPKADDSLLCRLFIANMFN
jgi:hypothetical protein